MARTFCELALNFWAFCQHQGQAFTEEAPIAYAVHMLCGNPYAHTLRASADLWASDWTGQFAGRLPDGTVWEFVDYFSGERFPVNPAVVHAMRSKAALLAGWLDRCRKPLDTIKGRQDTVAVGLRRCGQPPQETDPVNNKGLKVDDGQHQVTPT